MVTTVIERLEAERWPAEPATSSSAAVVQPTTFEGVRTVRALRTGSPLAPFRRGTSPRPPALRPRPAGAEHTGADGRGALGRGRGPTALTSLRDPWGPRAPRLAGPPARRPVPSHRRRPLLARRARLSLLAAVGTWEALITAMWWWWLTAAEHGDPVGFVAVSAALVPLTVLGPASYLIGAARLHRVEPSRHAGSGTPRVLVAVVRRAGVADVAVRHTVQVLQQQLDQDGQHGRRGAAHPTGRTVHVAVCDDEADPRLLAWCYQRGVHVSTRKGVAAYQQRHWPGRAGEREGALAALHDSFGRRLADVIVHVDAGRRPEAGFLDALLAPFADPQVAMVRAVDLDDEGPRLAAWGARAQLDHRAWLGGAAQDALDGPAAGNGEHATYAVRTAALRGAPLGPGPRDDLATALQLGAGGGRVEVAAEARTRGAGAAGFDELTASAYRHGRTAALLALSASALRRPWRSLRLLQPAMTSAAWLLLGLAVPWVAVTGRPLVGTTLPVLAIRWGVTFLPLVLVTTVLHLGGPLRRTTPRVASWELLLDAATTWPYRLAGTLAGLAGRLPRRPARHIQRRRRLGTLPARRLGGPAVVVAANLAAVLVLGRHGGPSAYLALGLALAALSLLAMGSVVVLHVRERIVAGDEPQPAWRSARTAVWLVSLLALAMVAALVVLAWPAVAPAVWPQR